MTWVVRTVFVIAATGLLLAAAPAAAQSRFDDVRLITGRHRQGFRNAHFDETRGSLTSDVQQRQLRFEARSERLLAIAFDRVVALHAESSRYPRRGLRRSGFYLVVHYLDSSGAPAFEMFRLPTSGADTLLTTIERDTGRVVDRSGATDSFLGLPIHVYDGDTVVISTESGRETKGRLRHLGPASIDVDTGTFPAPSVRRIRVTDSTAEGVVFGGMLAVLPAAFVSFGQCLHDCTVWRPFTPAGWGVIAGGMAIGASIDAAVLRTAYRGGQGGRSARSHWTPVITASTHTVGASWHF